DIVGFDVNEVVPPYDLSGITSVLAAKVILEIFNMIISK
ncbi:MAG: arginase family protein, partial [Thermoproteota archaeon]